MNQRYTHSLPLLLSVCLLTGTLLGEEEDPTEAQASIVVLDPPEQPADLQAPASQFWPSERRELWANALSRIASAPAESGGGFIDAVQLLGGEQFRSAKQFHYEGYGEGPGSDELEYVVAADEAVRKDKEIRFTRMRLIFFSGKTLSLRALGAAQKKKPEKASPPKQKKSAAKAKAAASITDFLPPGSRVVMTAPLAVFDLKSNEGRASGTVTLEIFHAATEGKAKEPSARLVTERLYWRTWREPAMGSTELVLYTPQHDQQDPLVKGVINRLQPDGTVASTRVEGRGLVFETGFYDELNTVYDEDFRTAGRTKTARNRAILHADIRMETTEATLSALLPFQGSGTDQKKKELDPPAPAAMPTQKVITCRGPAIIDMAAVPRVSKKNPPAADKGAVTEQQEAALETLVLARRMEFLNGVTLRLPADPKQNNDERDHWLTCEHVCLQYAPGAVFELTSFPEYAEAIGNVKMHGFNTTSVSAGVGAPPPNMPFDVRCDRIFFDDLNDNMFLVGSADKPVSIKMPDSLAEAPQFNFRRRAEALTMPATGNKRLLVAGPTRIEVRGPLVRELKHVPTPSNPKRTKEVLSLKDHVVIEQPSGGLKLSAQKVRLTRSVPEGELEYLEGEGNINVRMRELQATGHAFSVEIETTADRRVRKLIHVAGSRKHQTQATLFRGGSAIRADKFILEMIDEDVQAFRAFGGAVAVFKAPPKTKETEKRSEAAVAASALFKGLSFQPGGNMTIQCDGELSQDAKGDVWIRKNAIIRQDGMQMSADDVHISLADKTQQSKAAKGATDELFSGELKAIECLGNVELSTVEQLVQCDRLHYDVQNDRSELLMDDPDNDVRLYMSDGMGGTRFLSVQKSLNADSRSGVFQPGGMLLMLPYRLDVPAPRDKASSPARQKKTRAAATTPAKAAERATPQRQPSGAHP